MMNNTVHKGSSRDSNSHHHSNHTLLRQHQLVLHQCQLRNRLLVEKFQSGLKALGFSLNIVFSSQSPLKNIKETSLNDFEECYLYKKIVVYINYSLNTNFMYVDKGNDGKF